MKKLLVVLSFICFCFGAQAQSSKQKAPANAGSFLIKTTTAKGLEYINVNYALMAPFTNVLRFNLNTANPMSMSVKLTDMSGKVVLSWVPVVTDHLYETQLDISTLKPGTYHFNIYGANNTKVHSVSFIKS